MRIRYVAFVFFATLLGFGADKAVVTSMKTLKCGAPLAKTTVFTVLAGPDMESAGLSCMEFTLRTTRVQYRLRPSRQMLLPVGSTVRVRVDKKYVMVRVDDGKEIRCGVISMDLLNEDGEPVEPREDAVPTMSTMGAMTGWGMPRRPAPVVVPAERKRTCLNADAEIVRCGD